MVQSLLWLPWIIYIGNWTEGVLVLLNLSMAFNTINHGILLETLSRTGLGCAAGLVPEPGSPGFGMVRSAFAQFKLLHQLCLFLEMFYLPWCQML